MFKDIAQTALATIILLMVVVIILIIGAFGGVKLRESRLKEAHTKDCITIIQVPGDAVIQREMVER
jgi:hypothetical protein